MVRKMCTRVPATSAKGKSASAARMDMRGYLIERNWVYIMKTTRDVNVL